MIILNKVITPPKAELLKVFSDIIDSGVLTNNGPVVKKFENALAEANNSKHVLTTTNGTIALQLAIRALHLKGEIITTPFTFVASSSAIVWEGCKPVFADIDAETLCLDSKCVEQHINTNTSAILPVHIYGNLVDIDAIESIAKKHQLKTIYDGAQAYGSRYMNESAMNFGDITVLSLHAYKILNAIEGGVMFCKSQSVMDELFRIRYFGKDRSNAVVQLGINGKLTEINAAYGLLSLAQVSQEIAKREQIYKQFKAELSKISSLRFQKIEEKVSINYAYFPVIFPSEKVLLKIIDIAESNGIEIRRYFYPVLNAMEFFGCHPEETPVAFDISKRIACLPIYGSLSSKEIEKIVSLIKENM